MTEPTRAALAFLLLTAGCGPAPDTTSGLALPSEPEPPADVATWPSDLPQGWPEVRTTPLAISPGEGALLAATGYGVRWQELGAGGESVEVATPGWASAVVSRPEGVWVADGPAGLTWLRGSGLDLDYASTLRIGDVTDVAAAADRVLAITWEGLLLLLAPGADGSPVELERVVLDGRPADLGSMEDGALTRFAVATMTGGLVGGTVSSEGRIALTSRTRAYAQRAAAGAGGPVASSGTGRVWGPTPETAWGPLPGQAGALAVDRSGQLWAACGAAGVAVAHRGQRPGKPVLRVRRGAQAVTVASDPDGSGVWIGWGDGLVERLDENAGVLGSWRLGREGRITAVGGGLLAYAFGDGTSEVARPAGGRPIQLAGAVRSLRARADGEVVAAASEGGAVVLSAVADSLQVRQLHSGYALDARGDAGGGWWVADEAEGALYYPPEGTTPSDPVRLGAWGARAIGLSERWRVLAAETGGELRVTPAEGQPFSLLAGGDPTGLLLLGDRLLVGIPELGIEVFDLRSGPDARPDRLRLPVPRPGRRKPGGLCQARQGALVMLAERGVAAVTLESDGKPQLARLIETPGAAVACEASSPDGPWLIADTTGLLELASLSGGAATKAAGAP